ncbi:MULTISPECIES: hypothetical protein [unclassified Mesorhizobium]|uniref:hypothetical protein n=1 Tax=unclassified Mesorhizobium TaxID=325217 RepID=UPI0015E4578D|nr:MULTISPECIES: hypothetical protein [unclassified Mesorhizobium]MBZ9701673.1 hypothetical protein [Mesorhizobium sp. CO1-1-3]MBZ9949021.1 hypothetical protein [Mesorhizobium sp. BR1-1-11]
MALAGELTCACAGATPHEIAVTQAMHNEIVESNRSGDSVGYPRFVDEAFRDRCRPP